MGEKSTKCGQSTGFQRLRKTFPNESMLEHNVWAQCDADTNVFESDRH
jgi:hypothetical protein